MLGYLIWNIFMLDRWVPNWLRYAPTPGVTTFSVLFALESGARATLSSVYPVAVYRALDENEQSVAVLFFVAGLASLLWGSLVPRLTYLWPRRWVYSGGAAGLFASAWISAWFDQTGPLFGVTLQQMATVTVFICMNAYIMDYINRTELGRSESRRLFFSTFPWTICPFFGVWLMENVSFQAPFHVAMGFSSVLLVVFWWYRMGSGKVITRATSAPPNPIRYLPVFFRRPQLVASWLFSVTRSSGWVAYYTFVPIYTLHVGLGPQIGAAMVSMAGAYLLLVPLGARLMARIGIRRMIISAFCLGAFGWLTSAILFDRPYVTLFVLQFAALSMIGLDLSAGLPFLMTVKPSERNEMSAVYSSFRDVSGVLMPGLSSLVLLVAPLPGVFALAGTSFIGMAMLARRIPARLGQKRQRKP